MYLLASRISSSPSIRALETHFANIASRQLEESIAKADRLFDATRAAAILSTYKYSNARYHEGWMMVGLAARYVCFLSLTDYANM
jgi:nitrate reductase assembly molybdenum cofactor insertion protein NarJ